MTHDPIMASPRGRRYGRLRTMFEVPAPDTVALEKAAARARKGELRVEREAQRREREARSVATIDRRRTGPRPYRFRSPPGR